jgi:hypothetical protein
MNLKFEINEKYLFYEALFKGAKLDGRTDLQNELWDKYRKGYQLLQSYFNFNKVFISPNPDTYLQQSIEDMDKLIVEGMCTPLFKNLLKDTKEYKIWLEQEWDKNKEIVTKELRDILKIELPKNPVTVMVISNKMKGGQHIDTGVIMWGHSEDWPSYSLVYLAHEYLHDILAKSELEHAVIELATDNELRIRLNGTGDYFYINGKLVGHEFLFELEKKLLPNWKKYLTSKDKNIFEFIKEHASK